MSESTRETLMMGVNLTILGAVLFIAMMFFNLRGYYAKNVDELNAAEHLLTQSARYNSYDNKLLSGTEVVEALTRYYDTVPIFVDRAYNYKLDEGWIGMRRLGGTNESPNLKGLYTSALVSADATKLLLEPDSTKVPGDDTLTYWFPAEAQYAAVLCYNSAKPYDYAAELFLKMTTQLPTYLTGTPTSLIGSDALFKAVSVERDTSEVSGIIFILIQNPYAPNLSVYK